MHRTQVPPELRDVLVTPSNPINTHITSTTYTWAIWAAAVPPAPVAVGAAIILAKLFDISLPVPATTSPLLLLALDPVEKKQSPSELSRDPWGSGMTFLTDNSHC